MGIRLFYLSLLILSIAMGAQFNKNRPKTVPKQSKPPTVSINLDDLDLHQPDEAVSTSTAAAADTGSETTGQETASSAAAAPDEAESIGSPGFSAASKKFEDPVLSAFAKLQRNPFEPSPFAEMIQQAQASSAATIAADPTRASKMKPTDIMTGTNFSGTIETDNALVAIIDKKLYRTGEVYMGKTIRKIEKTHVTLDDPEKTYLLPKFGVSINISSDTLSVVDDFMKKQGK